MQIAYDGSTSNTGKEREDNGIGKMAFCKSLRFSTEKEEGEKYYHVQIILCLSFPCALAKPGPGARELGTKDRFF